MSVFESNGEDETRRFAAELARSAKAGDVICLDGELGVGKTAFARGFAEGLGIEEPVLSPTFTIMRGYESGRLPMYHFDAYRIVEPEEMYELGFEEYLFGEGVCLIEWVENITEMIPKDAMHIVIEKDMNKGSDYRKITVNDGRDEK